MTVGQNVCLRNVQTNSGHYPAPYTVGSLHALPGVQRPEREA